MTRFRHLLLVSAALGCLDAAAAAPPPGGNDPGDEASVRVVTRMMPAVVNINTERVIRLRESFDTFFFDFFGRPWMRRPREYQHRIQSLGSGFLIDEAGHIVTNEHVVQRAADLKIQVTTADGKRHSARYVAGDPATDLAVIKVDAPGPFPHVDLGELSPNRLGQTVLVLGNPLGYGSSVSRGIVSAVDREVQVGDQEYTGLVQTDAAINPGNSGGPVLDLAGRLVGVSSVKLAYTDEGVPTQGLGFAIPASKVRDLLADLRTRGPAAAGPEVRRATPATPAGAAARQRLGLDLQDLTDDLAAALGLRPGAGALVSRVEPGSPADRVGLTRGMVIAAAGGAPVAGVAELETRLAAVPPGAEIALSVRFAGVRAGILWEDVRTVRVRTR